MAPELKEVLAAIDLLAIDIIKLAKQKKSPLEILAALVGDAALRASLEKAVDNISKIPAEAAALKSDLPGLLDLLVFEAQQVPAMLEALKG